MCLPVCLSIGAKIQPAVLPNMVGPTSYYTGRQSWPCNYTIIADMILAAVLPYMVGHEQIRYRQQCFLIWWVPSSYDTGNNVPYMVGLLPRSPSLSY